MSDELKTIQQNLLKRMKQPFQRFGIRMSAGEIENIGAGQTNLYFTLLVSPKEDVPVFEFELNEKPPFKVPMQKLVVGKNKRTPWGAIFSLYEKPYSVHNSNKYFVNGAGFMPLSKNKLNLVVTVEKIEED